MAWGRLEEFRRWAREREEGRVPSLKEISGWGVRAVKSGERDANSAVRVEVRMDPVGGRIVRITAKSFLRRMAGEETGLADRLANWVRNRLPTHLHVQVAGEGSINVSPGNHP